MVFVCGGVEGTFAAVPVADEIRNATFSYNERISLSKNTVPSNRKIFSGIGKTHSIDTAIVLGAGAVLGAFMSRVLADTPLVTLPFFRWELTILLTLIGAAGTYTVYRWSSVRQPGRFGSSTQYIVFYVLLIYVFQPTPNLLQAGVLLAGMLTILLYFSIPWPDTRQDRWVMLMLLLITLGVYLSTLTPGIGTRDGYELQAVSATLGFAHPTGYPLFSIIGRMWLTMLPFGSIAWRINVLCALFAATSVPLLYATARRILGLRSLAVLSACVLAFSSTLWTQAVRPEKYTLNALFVALILYIAFGIADPEQRGPHPHLRWLALAYGLSMAHHRTMLMLAPALVLYLLWRDPSLIKRPRDCIPALCIALAPLLIYLYIPWRAAAQGWYMTMPEFMRYITGAYYGPAVRLMDWLNPERAWMFWRFLLAQFGYPGVALGLLGLVGLGLRGQWRTLLCTSLAYMTYYVWGTVYHADYNDINSFIPNHIIFALWIGSGALIVRQSILYLTSIFGGLQIQYRWTNRLSPTYTQAAFWSLCSLLPLSMLWTNAPNVNARSERNLSTWGEYAITQDIAPGATILADREKHPPLDYYSRIEGQRPDIDVVILGDENAYVDRLMWDIAHEKKVYLARFLPRLEGNFYLRSLGPLVEVGTTPLTLEEITTVSAISGFGDHIQLLWHQVEDREPLRPGDTTHVTLFWHALATIPSNYQVNMRLVSAAGQEWWKKSNYAVSGMYPTTAWKTGSVIPDWHEIPIAQTIPPGMYMIEVGLFPPFSSHGLHYAEQRVWLPLDTIEVLPGDSEPEISHPLRVIAPGQWQLLGYDLPRQAPPTSRVTLTLYWQALAPLPDLEIGTRLVSDDGEGAWTWSVPGQGEYPATSWQLDTPIVTAHTLTMPATEGKVTVHIALREDFSTSSSHAKATFYPRWLGEKTTLLALPPITVAGQAPAAPGIVNYGDHILMLDTDLGARTLQPGTPLELSVRWQCMQAMENDYTLFVQLLAPDGTLRGQVDLWPKDGTHPTSVWREGEIILDRYQVYVDGDAPEGDYHIAVGWYLLKTMQRLPVLNAAGQEVEDKALLTGLQVAR